MSIKYKSGRVIKVPARGDIVEVTVTSFAWPSLNRELYGDPHMLVERVRPYGLAQFNGTLTDTEVVVLVDEDGIAKRLPFNARASFIYGWQFHGQPILGDAYFVGQSLEYFEDGPDWTFHGLPDTFTTIELDSVLRFAAIATNERELAGK